MGESPRMKPCVSCGEEIPLRATKCRVCKSAQEHWRCRVCKEPKLELNLRCNACGTPGDWRRFIPFSQTVLALLIALFSVLTTTIPAVSNFLDRHSNTSIKVTGSDANTIFVKVRNSGRQPSELVSYQLHFGDVKIEDAELILGQIDQQPSDTVIKPGDPVKIGLTTRIGQELQLKPKLGGGAYTEREIEEQLHKATVELDVRVQESGDEAGNHQTRPASFTGDLIKQFVKGGIHWSHPGIGP